MSYTEVTSRTCKLQLGKYLTLDSTVVDIGKARNTEKHLPYSRSCYLSKSIDLVFCLFVFLGLYRTSIYQYTVVMVLFSTMWQYLVALLCGNDTISAVLLVVL